MAQFSVNAQRLDRFKNFKFRVKWDGRYVAGLGQVSALKRSTQIVEHREGGDPSTGRKSPGRTKFEAVTLGRSVSHNTEFEKWANKVWNFGSGLGAEMSWIDHNGVLSEAEDKPMNHAGGRRNQSREWVNIPVADNGEASSPRSTRRAWRLFLHVRLRDRLLPGGDRQGRGSGRKAPS